MSNIAGMRRGSRRGFTMVEIILVVVIIMALAMVVAPKLTGQARKQRENITKISMTAIKSALQNFETEMSRFPTTQEGLQALVTRPSGIDEADWPGQKLEELPRDAFGTPFRYACPSDNGMDYDLISAGADRKFGTEDDIANYDRKNREENL